MLSETMDQSVKELHLTFAVLLEQFASPLPRTVGLRPNDCAQRIDSATAEQLRLLRCGGVVDAFRRPGDAFCDRRVEDEVEVPARTAIGCRLHPERGTVDLLVQLLDYDHRFGRAAPSCLQHPR